MSLPIKYRAAVETFEQELHSVKYSQNRDIQCAQEVNKLLPFQIGRLYVDKYFKDSTRNKAEKLVAEIRQSMLQIFSDSKWMDDETKEKAKEKAKYVLDFIGYSTRIKIDKNFETIWINFTGLDFLTSMRNLRVATSKSRFNLLQSIISRNSTSIFPAVVNAFYNPLKNSINFPAAILQKPFFDGNYPSSLQHGAFGAVVGHEFTHGFDNQGALYNKIGNKVNWWDNETKDTFNRRAEGLKKQYAEFNLCNGDPDCQYKIDGNRTLGENIADNGGLKAAFKAYKKNTETKEVNNKRLPGVDYTADQLFFAGFAHIWCRRFNDHSLSAQLKNEHSPAQARVMVTLMNSYEFSEAFKCPVNSRMNPKEKQGVW